MDVKLIVTGGSKRSSVIPLRLEETIIGRQRDCDVRIASSLVSRRHCRLSFRDGRLMVEDLASANGTFLNGVAVEGEEMVRPGDRLEMGPISFRVEYQLATSAVERMQQENIPPRIAPEVAPMAEVLPMGEILPMGEVLQDSLGPLPMGEIIPVSVPEPNLPKSPAPPERRQRRREKETAAGSDSATVNFDELAWRAPKEDDLRDILSQMEDE
jgi:predicted component of type VI protein secretion system